MTPTERMSGSTAKYCHTSRLGVPRADLLAHDRVGAPQRLELLVRDLADDAHGEAGARERLAVDDLVGQAELGAHRADLVLEERLAAAR